MWCSWGCFLWTVRIFKAFQTNTQLVQNCSSYWACMKGRKGRWLPQSQVSPLWAPIACLFFTWFTFNDKKKVNKTLVEMRVSLGALTHFRVVRTNVWVFRLGVSLPSLCVSFFSAHTFLPGFLPQTDQTGVQGSRADNSRCSRPSVKLWEFRS